MRNSGEGSLQGGVVATASAPSTNVGNLPSPEFDMKYPRRPRCVLLGLLAAALACAGCDGSSRTADSNLGAASATGAGDSTPPVSSGVAMSATAHTTGVKQPKMSCSDSDDWITVRSVSALRANQELGSGIHVATNSGRVVLSGTAASEAESEQAVSVVRVVDGVIRVDNQISIH